MKIKGTIIITDPCYIIKEQKMPETLKYPKESDYISYNKDEEYPDCKDGKSETLTKELKKYQEALYKYREEADKYDDWRKCDYGEDMEALGIETYICNDTLYGDWSCTTYKTEKDPKNLINRICKYYMQEDDKGLKTEFNDLKVIGNFCADAGMVAVFLLDEVLKYNPDFNDWIKEYDWCVTKIDNFDGNVEYYVDENTEAHIIGIGNINFVTLQTGL